MEKTKVTVSSRVEIKVNSKVPACAAFEVLLLMENTHK